MKWKRMIVWAVVGVMFFSTIGISPVFADTLQDVPTDHWAYDAVRKLVDRGYMTVFEDGTFQGTRAVDRYALASALANMLDDIEAGQVEATTEDLELIEELTTEFREELVQWYAERDEVEEKLSETQRMASVTEDRLHRVTASQVELQEEVAQIRADLMEEAERTQQTMSEYEQALELLAQRASERDERLTEKDEDLEVLQRAMVQLEEELLEQQAALEHLENWAGEKGAVFQFLEDENVKLREEIHEALETEIGQYRDDLDALQSGFEELRDLVAETDAGLSDDVAANREQLEQLSERNQELERDLQNLAVRLQREADSREDLEDDVDALVFRVDELETQVGVSEEELEELSRKISEEISVQMSTAVMREQRLERQLGDLKEEFSVFKEEAEQTHSSLRSQATIGMVIGAIGILVGFIGN